MRANSRARATATMLTHARCARESRSARARAGRRVGASGDDDGGRGVGRREDDAKRGEYDVPYDVVNAKSGDPYELRVYGAYYVAATTYENRERGLTTLLEYLEGGNAEGAMYPPTQPLTTRYFEGGKTMELALLGRRARESIAAPYEDSEVKVVAGGGELLAAMTFEGNATPDVAEFYRSKLVSALEANGLKCADDKAFRINTFGPLYSLKTRRNELLMQVAM
jgi:pre-mRNA-processing factor 19